MFTLYVRYLYLQYLFALVQTFESGQVPYNTVHALFMLSPGRTSVILHFGLDCAVELHLYLKRDVLQGV